MLNSTVIAGFLKVGEDLLVRFKSGYVYKYFNVPDYVVNEFEDAPSLGKFFNSEIKNKYPTALVV